MTKEKQVPINHLDNKAVWSRCCQVAFSVLHIGYAFWTLPETVGNTVKIPIP